MGGEKCCLNGADVSDGNSPCIASIRVRVPLKGKEGKKEGLFSSGFKYLYSADTENNFIKGGCSERIKEEFVFSLSLYR